MNINYQTALIASIKAGEAIMQIYNKDFSVNYKDDASPLTEADAVANNIILGILTETGIPIISDSIFELSFSR